MAEMIWTINSGAIKGLCSMGFIPEDVPYNSAVIFQGQPKIGCDRPSTASQNRFRSDWGLRHSQGRHADACPPKPAVDFCSIDTGTIACYRLLWMTIYSNNTPFPGSKSVQILAGSRRHRRPAQAAGLPPAGPIWAHFAGSIAHEPVHQERGRLHSIQCMMMQIDGM